MNIELYQLYDTTTKQRASNSFNTRDAARRARRIFNREAKNPLRYIVVPGPAHPKYQASKS